MKQKKVIQCILITMFSVFFVLSGCKSNSEIKSQERIPTTSNEEIVHRTENKQSVIETPKDDAVSKLIKEEDILVEVNHAIQEKFVSISEAKYHVGEPQHLANGDYTKDGILYMLFSVPYTLYEYDGSPREIEYDVFVETDTFEVYEATYKTESGEALINDRFTRESIMTLEEMYRIDFEEKIQFLEVSGYAYAVSPNEEKIVYEDFDGVIRLWQGSNLDEQSVSIGDVVSNFVWSSDSNSLLIDQGTSPLRNGTIITWSENEMSNYELSYVGKLYFSPESSMIAGMKISDKENKYKEGFDIGNCLDMVVLNLKTGEETTLYQGEPDDSFEYSVDGWMDNQRIRADKIEILNDENTVVETFPIK